MSPPPRAAGGGLAHFPVTQSHHPCYRQRDLSQVARVEKSRVPAPNLPLEDRLEDGGRAQVSQALLLVSTREIEAPRRQAHLTISSHSAGSETQAGNRHKLVLVTASLGAPHHNQGVRKQEAMQVYEHRIFPQLAFRSRNRGRRRTTGVFLCRVSLRLLLVIIHATGPTGCKQYSVMFIYIYTFLNGNGLYKLFKVSCLRH
jgi:hypothetical protein